MEIKRDHVTFSTGRVMYANRGIIGIDSLMDVFYGYDGGFDVWPRPWMDNDPGLTKEERLELADYMISLWTTFRDADGPIQEKEE